MPAVCRGAGVDFDVVHCSLPLRDERSSDVKVNGTGISRQGDMNTVHRGILCKKHKKPIASGSSTVKINGQGCGRIGDAITSCTLVASGSSNVFAGP